MKTSKKIILGTICLILITSAFLAYRHYKENASFAKPVGKLITSPNEKLQSTINTYMESQKSEYDLGRENYHCSNDFFGYDDKYIYAWVVCNGFLSEEEKLKFKNEPYHSPKMSGDGKLEYGTGFSIPTRLEYTRPNYQIVSFKQPKDGTSYSLTYQQIFPREFFMKYSYAGFEIGKLIKETENKAKAQIKN